MQYSDYSVLVVDDDETNRKILHACLQKEGYTVSLAKDGKEALDLAKLELFDLVLLDVMMPEVDGYQVLEDLKKNEKTKHIPVIMTTALKEAGSVTKCVRLGAQDYVVKPYDLGNVRSRVWRVLSKEATAKRPGAPAKAPIKTHPSQILVVDNIDTSRRLVCERLASGGHHVKDAASVEAALQMLDAERVQLLVIDISNIGIESEQVIDKARKTEKTAHIPIVVITTADNAEETRRCMKLGATDGILKPFHASALRARIETCIAHEKLRASAG